MFFAEIASMDGLIAIVVVAVLVFGGSAIPKLARNLGSAKSEFEKGLKEAKASSDAKASSEATDAKATEQKPTDTPS